MREIGVLTGGKSRYGGSYQYWLSVIKALSEITLPDYHITVFSKDENWIRIAKEYHLDAVKLNEKKSWMNRRIENNFWGFRHVPLVGRLLGYLYKHFDCDLKIIRKSNLGLYIAQEVNGAGDVLKIPTLMPIFDLMHRYDHRFPELTSGYEWREQYYTHQCQVAEIILADSEVGKQHIVESYGSLRKDLDKHVKILPFIPPDYIYTAVPKPPKEKLFDKFIFYPAQFWTHKNHKNLILAAARLKKKGIPVKLVFVGSEQNNKENVLKWIEQENLEEDIRILGYVTNDEMVYLYKNARAMVMPTCLGPTNIPQLEAFELGCPVATSGIYGIPDQVGDAALLFNPDSVEEIADCVERLWTDDGLCETLIQKGREKAAAWGQKQFGEALFKIIRDYFEEGVAEKR